MGGAKGGALYPGKHLDYKLQTGTTSELLPDSPVPTENSANFSLGEGRLLKTRTVRMLIN